MRLLPELERPGYPIELGAKWDHLSRSAFLALGFPVLNIWAKRRKFAGKEAV